jgi:hypothetical protein
VGGADDARDSDYGITQGPRVVAGTAIIGNSGAK